MGIKIKSNSISVYDNGEAVALDALKGDPGVSPTIQVSDITNGHKVTITDKDGTKTFNVTNGTNYNITEQDKSAIAAAVKNEVQPTITELSETVDYATSALDTKVGFSEVVGNQLKMYRDSTKAVLLATLDLPQTDISGKQDTISDLDTIRSGAASGATALQSVPIATNLIAGIVKYSTAYGTNLNGNNQLVTYKATNGDIEARAHDYRPIVPSNLNYAVKAALTDSNAIVLDDASKKACCATLGAYQKPTDGWVLKGTMTDPSGINVDLTGCTELSVIGTITATGTTHLQSSIGIMIHSATYSGSRKFVVKFSDDIFGIFPTEAKYNNNVSSTVCTVNYSTAYTYYGSQTISGITKLFFSDTALVTSCDIKIYAR